MPPHGPWICTLRHRYGFEVPEYFLPYPPARYDPYLLLRVRLLKPSFL